MPNTPKKIKDPTEAALSAIQDVLSIRDEVTPEPQPNAAPAIETQPEAPVLDDASFEPPWRQTDAPSEVDSEKSGIPLPRMSQVQVLPDLSLSVGWAEGPRTGTADVVDLSPVINTYKFYRPLRKNKELFQTAHLVDDGHAIEWGDGTIDMSAELIEDIASQTMRPQDFAEFLEHNKLTQEAAAALLGYSRRQIGYYLTTGPIPRVVALACYGYEARSSVCEERQRVAGSAQVAEEARMMLSQVTQIFTDFKREFKQIKSEVLREVETTRDELHKCFELPEAVAKSAAQMRRIVDQVEALAELHRVVARHAGRVDEMGPSGVPHPERVTAPHAPVLHSRPDITGMSTQPIAARRSEAPPVSAANARVGWPSELLTRPLPENELAKPAVREPRQEAPAAERSTIRFMDSLAFDIARMVDHDAIAELWERYTRGERNVFSRKLYTSQGQRAFDDIRKQYDRDREFKLTVDRYIGEFERLLEEVARDDRGQAMARTYLTSEIGKVYTLLAHASRRFD